MDGYLRLSRRKFDRRFLTIALSTDSVDMRFKIHNCTKAHGF
ncbi:hypothetical protein GXM_05923 [Nostoc sphaeroides CCNUC1]|uniref:Uncharacterized protein n=1 Tax=Nostoc sphaeroides CCNUC1 TaxID=2653204 RepID=A0A5P8W8Y3_9NOSO|nr:hypothetical protein GXM_05923 [Nostoc sphaeroides CCNUC1]